MKTVACQGCAARVATNDSVFIHDRGLCIPCAERAIADAGGSVPQEAVRREPDPTVCAKCGVDAGARELPRLAGLPVCDACEHGFRHYPFPWWVKLSFAAVMALCGAGLVHNWRFIRGYTEALQSRTAIAGGDADRAAALAASAAARVPESPEILAMGSLFKGLSLLRADKDAEAVPHLRAWKQFAPSDDGIDLIILQAETGAAFERKDYDAFLDGARNLLARLPNDAGAIGMVASALACKYATTGDEQFRRDAIEHLDKARAASAGDPAASASLAEYEQRIRHRLDTRDIIDRAAFNTKYPNGYPATQPSGGAGDGAQEVEHVHPR